MGLFAVRIIQHRPRKRLKVGVVQFAAGLPRRNCTKIKKRPKKNIKVMGINKDAGKRSEVPFSRREEGRELGEKEKENEKREKKKRKVMKRKKKNVVKRLWGSL